MFFVALNYQEKEEALIQLLVLLYVDDLKTILMYNMDQWMCTKDAV